MQPVDIHDLRLAADHARGAYVSAQAHLLADIEGAQRGQNPWPTPAQYDAIRTLGIHAAQALRVYLDAIRMPRAPHRSSFEKMRLIERLSRGERRWQPTPEAWLRRHDIKP